MNYLKQTWILLTLALILTGCGTQQASRMEYIGADAAKNLALEAAGLAANQVEFFSTDMVTREGLDYYQVEFSSGGQSYRYDIDALSGVVIDSQTPQGAAPEAGQTTTTPPEGSLITDADTYGPAQQAPAESTQNTPAASAGNGDILSAEEAKAAALAHAGLTADQVTFIKSGLDWDDGRQTYDLEFYTADYKEYDYEIDPYTGEVIQFDFDAEYYAPPAPSTGGSTGNSGNSGTITEEEAKAKALAQVPGATVDDIWEFQIDYDDGRLEYEGKIYYNSMEYEFEIDGYSGAIRTWDVESIYD